MQTIYEKLARCSTDGEVKRMLDGNGMEILPKPKTGTSMGHSVGIVVKGNSLESTR